jgi:ferric-dicitrate binding protein FerR (iron transport regulator)
MELDQHSDFFLQKESFRNWVEGRVEEDCRFWDRWFQENPGQLPSAMRAARVLAGLPSLDEQELQEQVQQSWDVLNSRIDSFEKKNAFFRWTINRAAAVVAMIAVFFGSWYVFQPVTESFATGYSNRRSVVLSDGTEIMMNANTKITAKRSWRFAPPREVWVDGEAYFLVKSHKEEEDYKNFIVHTYDMDITVTGTQFNVNTRSKGTRVFLNEGKIEVALKENPSRRVMQLIPGETLAYSGMQDPQTARKEVVEPDAQLAWKSGYFSFNKTPLSEVLEMVYSTHGVRITVEDSSLLGETISGRVPNSNVDELVNSVSKLFNLKHSRNGSGIRLWK